MTIESFAIALLILLMVGFYCFRGVIDIRNAFAPPLIVSGLTFNTLVISFYQFDADTRNYLLNEEYYFMALLYALLCLLLFAVSYEWGVLKRSTRPRKVTAVDNLSVHNIAVILVPLVAAGFAAHYYVASLSGGLVAYYSEAHGAAGKYGEISGYIHALPTMLWSAFAISFSALLTMRQKSMIILALFVLTGLAVGAHTFLFGNRNGLIRAAIILGIIYCFVRRPSFVKSLPVMVGLIVMAVATQIIIYIRGDLHLGSDVSLMESLQAYFERRADSGGYLTINWQSGAGHELFFNVAVIEASSIAGVHDFGAHYIYPLINFIPRSIWPGKPYQDEFGVNLFDLTTTVLGWDPGKGAAYSSLSQSFLAFSWFGSLVWALLGYVSGRAFAAARNWPTVWSLGILIALDISLVFWITQSYNAFFWNWFITIAAYFLLRLFAALFFPARRRRAEAVPYLSPVNGATLSRPMHPNLHSFGAHTETGPAWQAAPGYSERVTPFMTQGHWRNRR